MRKISCLVTSWVVLLMVVFFSSINVEAITIDNDGNARENPYGDSKLPSSYTSGDYYDCYLPYNLTPADIGGYSDSVIASVNDTYNYSMVSKYPDRINSKFTSSVNIYKLVSSIGSSYQGCSVSTEADTGAGIVTDANGGKYYMTAIQKFFYNFPGVEMEGSTFPGWSMANTLGVETHAILVLCSETVVVVVTWGWQLMVIQ